MPNYCTRIAERYFKQRSKRTFHPFYIVLGIKWRQNINIFRQSWFGPKIRASRLGKVLTGSQEVYHNYDYLLDKRNSKHCREYLPTPSLYLISICFRIEKNGEGGGGIHCYISRGFLLESPTRDPNSKVQLEVQPESPTRNPNSKSQLGT